MPDTRVALAGLWAALMFTYLLGDVLRIFAGDFQPGRIAGVEATPQMWVGIALIMLVPIVMMVVTLTVDHAAIRWITIAVTILVAAFNVIGLPYPGAYDNLLIVVSLGFNALIGWQAWTWAA